MRRSLFLFKYCVKIRPLLQIFQQAQSNAQLRPLDIFFRSKSLLDFQSALNHIYQNLPIDPVIVYQLPKLISQVDNLSQPSKYYKLFALKQVPNISQHYENQLLKSTYINTVKQNCGDFTPSDIYSIHLNLVVLLEQNQKTDVFNLFEEKALSQLFDKMMDSFVQKLPLFQTNVKYNMMLMAKSLKVFNFQFSNFLKYYFLNNFRQFKLLEALTIMSYLSDAKSFPYNLFYKIKDELLQIIAPTPLLLDKNQASLLKLLEILSKQRLFYCQKLIERSYNLLYRNIDHLDIHNLIRSLYYYSRSKYYDVQLLQAIVALISKNVSQINSKMMKLMLISLGNLKNDDMQLIGSITTNQPIFQSISNANFQNQVEYFQKLRQKILQYNKKSQAQVQLIQS